MHQSPSLRRLPVVVALAAILAAFAAFTPLAQAAKTAPGYENFKGCPTKAEYPTVATCTHSVVNSGFVQMGSKEVPIENPITLSGGFGSEGFKAGPEGGLTLVKQKVPGGVIGWTGLTWLLEFLGSEALTLYAVTEPAGQPKVGLEGLTLPVKVHLINSVLGNNCRVGSVSDPITFNLTNGTTEPPLPNKPISGTPGKFELGPPPSVFRTTGGIFVDNSFRAPGANGCVLTLFGFIPISINGLVNSTAGLPAAAGTNTTEQQIDVELVAVSKVYP